ncbi:MAG: RuvA C-terminal domain-containing protein, partial [Nannocystaceae bacterium]
AAQTGHRTGGGSSLHDQAQETLVAWGFKLREVEAAVEKVQQDQGASTMSLEELLRRAAQVITAG